VEGIGVELAGPKIQARGRSISRLESSQCLEGKGAERKIANDLRVLTEILIHNSINGAAGEPVDSADRNSGAMGITAMRVKRLLERGYTAIMYKIAGPMRFASGWPPDEGLEARRAEDAEPGAGAPVSVSQVPGRKTERENGLRRLQRMSMAFNCSTLRSLPKKIELD